MRESLDFSNLEVIEVKVPIGGEIYTLKEASGDAAVAYMNKQAECTVLGPDGKAQKVENIGDIQPLLVHYCLHDSTGQRVPEKKIRGWPNRVQKALFLKAQEISELDSKSTLPALEKQYAELGERIAKLKAQEAALKNA